MTSFAHDLFNGGDTLLYFTDLVAERAAKLNNCWRLTFQLTAAEARLASSLAAGEGIGAASARLAISRETARTQLRAIFAKTGTRRQAELTALLSRLRRPTQRSEVAFTRSGEARHVLSPHSLDRSRRAVRASGRCQVAMSICESFPKCQGDATDRKSLHWGCGFAGKCLRRNVRKG